MQIRTSKATSIKPYVFNAIDPLTTQRQTSSLWADQAKPQDIDFSDFHSDRKRRVYSVIGVVRPSCSIMDISLDGRDIIIVPGFVYAHLRYD